MIEKDAEIERLKEALHEAGVRNGKLVLQLREKDLLITELCDALEQQSCWSTKVELIKRAREATK